LKKVKDGVITEKEGLEYMYMIKTRTDNLIGMKVLPKQIVNETNIVENKKLLAELEGQKLLTGGDISSDNKMGDSIGMIGRGKEG
jgi:hypothetical protein